MPKDERVGLSRGGMLEIVCLRVFTRRKFCNVGDTPFDRLRTNGFKTKSSLTLLFLRRELKQKTKLPQSLV